MQRENTQDVSVCGFSLIVWVTLSSSFLDPCSLKWIFLCILGRRSQAHLKCFQSQSSLSQHIKVESSSVYCFHTSSLFVSQQSNSDKAGGGFLKSCWRTVSLCVSLLAEFLKASKLFVWIYRSHQLHHFSPIITPPSEDTVGKLRRSTRLTFWSCSNCSSRSTVWALSVQNHCILGNRI